MDGLVTQSNAPPVHVEQVRQARPAPQGKAEVLQSKPEAPQSNEDVSFVEEEANSDSHSTFRSVEIDPETQSVVFKLISEDSGSVVVQIPSEVQLNVRAYVLAAETDTEAQPSVNEVV